MPEPRLLISMCEQGIHMLKTFLAETEEGVYCRVFQVLHFMQRVEPYTTMGNHLNQKTDHVDSMFTDIASTWNDVLENVDDVKELV